MVCLSKFQSYLIFLHILVFYSIIQLLDPKEAQRQVAYERQLDLLAAQLDDGEKRLADFNDALDVQRLIERTLNY